VHAEAALAAAGAVGVESMQVYAAAALGAGALASGEAATAAAHLARARRAFDEQGARCPTAVPFAGDLVDAADEQRPAPELGISPSALRGTSGCSG
jgi:hypothetical protein